MIAMSKRVDLELTSPKNVNDFLASIKQKIDPELQKGSPNSPGKPSRRPEDEKKTDPDCKNGPLAFSGYFTSISLVPGAYAGQSPFYRPYM